MTRFLQYRPAGNSRTMERSRLDALAVGDVATGNRHIRAVHQLRRSRVSRVLLLLTAALSNRPQFRDAIDVLCAAQEINPDEVAGVLTYPWVSVWATHCVRSPDPGHLWWVRAVAAAAALRTGMHDQATAALAGIEKPTPIPSIGLLTEESIDSLATHDGRSSNRLLLVSVGTGETRLTVTVDDIDPWRDCHGRPVSPRLAASERRQWSALIEESWDLLTAHAPNQAAEAASILTSVVPLQPDPAYANVSVTNGDAFGGFAADLVSDSAGFAATVVHEATHNKVNALHDLDPLHTDDGQARYFAPWRPDSRPLGGVIHGLAAFAAVAEVWQRLRAVPRLEERATRQLPCFACNSYGRWTRYGKRRT
jgi:HEXXH motif-containing protein